MKLWLIAALSLLSTTFSVSQCWPRVNKVIPAEDLNRVNRLGHSIDQYGDVMVVGAPNSDSLSYNAGIVYVFEKNNGSWVKVADLYPSDISQNRWFGQHVVIYGNTIMVADMNHVGVPMGNGYQMGAVYVYERPVSGWQSMSETLQILPPTADNVYFANSIDLYEDKLIVGSYFTLNADRKQVGAAYIYERNGTGWEKVADLSTGKQGNFGKYVAISHSICVIAASEEVIQDNSTGYGGAYVFEEPVDGWASTNIPDAKLTRSVPGYDVSTFGESMAINDSTIFIADSRLYDAGVYYMPVLYAFNRPAGGWTNATEDALFYDPGRNPLLFKSTVAMEDDKAYFFGEESVLVFDRGGNTWNSLTPSAELKASGINKESLLGFSITVSNGRVLASAPGLQAYTSTHQVTVRDPKIFEFVEPDTGWLPAINAPSDSVTYMERAGSGSYFSNAIDVDGNYAVVGAQHDNTNGESAGSAYVLEFDGKVWNRIGELTASDGQSYDKFGYSVTISGDFIVVSAPFHDTYENGPDRPSAFTTGAVYVYKKPPSGWTSKKEDYKIELANKDLKSFGRSVSLDMPYLVVGQYADNSSSDLGTAFVFELGNDNWTQRARLIPSVDGPGDGFAQVVAIEDSLIVVGQRPSRWWFLEMNRVHVYKMPPTGWKDTTESAVLYPSDVGVSSNYGGRMFGYSLDIARDEIIVGCPGWIGGDDVFDTSNLFRGAAYVYEKPAQGWQGMIKEQGILKLNEDIPYHNFGKSVRLDERYAIIGAPQNWIYTYGGQNPGKGKVYFFQRPETGWSEKTPDKVFTGDDLETDISDYFGVSVASTFGYMLIGSLLDDNVTGKDAGSVYVYTEYPYIEQAPSPVCDNVGLIDLVAFPEGGVWSGPGVPDPSLPVFDPSLVPGQRVFISYKVDDCDASNRIIINVIEHIKPFEIGDADSLYFCKRESVRLEVEQKRGVRYEWFYSVDGTDYQPVESSSRSNFADAKESGYYLLSQYNWCGGENDDVWVGDMDVNAGLDFDTCTPGSNIQLTGATPPDGNWSGPGVSNGSFSPTNVGTGQHEIYYAVSPEPDCFYTDTLTVGVDVIPTIALSSVDTASFCFTGSSHILATVYLDHEYEWYRADTPTGPYESLGVGIPVLNVDELGVYKVTATTSLGCVGESPPFTVEPNFELALNPEGRFTFCEDDAPVIEATQVNNALYSWSFTPDMDHAWASIGFNNPQMSVDLPGFYQLIVRAHGCEFESPVIEAYKFQPDSVFIPNVITPNGDNFNEALEVYTQGIDTYRLTIYNRHGASVFEAGNESPAWRGDVSDGVYYWLMSYRSQCEQDGMKILKGWVQVIGGNR